MDLGLRDRTVLVTGASGAIGGAIATAFAREGATVAAGWHRAQDKIDALVDTIKNDGGTAIPVQLDQRDPDAIEATLGQLGPVAILVAAAVTWPTRAPETPATLTDTLTANVTGTLTVIDQVLPGMRADGWGRLVLISTDVVDQPMPAGVGYPAAKGALETAARVLAAREACHGVLTNIVRPGFTLTDKALHTPGLGRPAIDAEAARTPTGRICTPADIATLTTYLGSPANTHVNGETISVSGGRQLTR